ncbi:MAG: competence protein ComEC [Microbacterium sp.]|nr:MAG: competence protein ComEC [Microbacterium sp.]
MSEPVSVSRARRRDARLVPVAAAAWIAAALTIVHPDAAVAAAITGWLGAGTALLLAARMTAGRRTWCALCAVCLAAAAAASTHVALAEPARSALREVDVSGGRSLILELTAVGKIEHSAVGWRFDGTVQSVRAGSGPVTVIADVPVVVRSSEGPPGLDLGSRVRVSGTAWPTDAGERAVLVVDAAATPEVLAVPAGPLAAASDLRNSLRALTVDLPPPGGGLIAGLAVGDTSAVDPALDAAMKTSSLSHLTAVSGANCALVVAIAFGIAAGFRARRGVRVAAGVAALVAFVVLVSPEPSVVRAASMAAIAMLGILLGRPGAGLSLLTTAVIVVLVLDPWLALSLGFGLSVAATGALLVAAGPLADGLVRWMPRPLALGISVPLAAQLACGPLIVLIAPQLSTYGVIANLVAAPAAPAGTLLGLAACLASGIPLLGSGLAALAWVPAAWVATTATTFAGLPGSVVAWPEGFGGLLALSALGAVIAAVIMPAPARVRTCAVLLLSVVLGIGVATGPVSDVIDRTGVPTDWSIVACDVGQGDALLVRSAGRIALIDTGPTPEALARCLSLLGIGHIDLLVLTHFDLDHHGGVDAVRGRVGTLLHGPPDGAEAAALLDRLVDAGARSTTAVRGMTGTLGDSRWRVLWPRLDTSPGNDASVTVEFTGGGVPASIFLGDLSAEGQQAMAAGTVFLDAYDVVKVAHHGSADQWPALYARLHPSLALLSVGENDYGHPRAETMTMLTSIGARIARTDTEGMLAVERDAEGLHLWRARAPTGVAPGG